MRLKNILNDSEIQDIPILYVLRVITAVQKEIINEESSAICTRLSESYHELRSDLYVSEPVRKFDATKSILSTKYEHEQSTNNAARTATESYKGKWY
jgi:hypothetical protein